MRNLSMWKIFWRYLRTKFEIFAEEGNDVFKVSIVLFIFFIFYDISVVYCHCIFYDRNQFNWIHEANHFQHKIRHSTFGVLSRNLFVNVLVFLPINMFKKYMSLHPKPEYCKLMAVIFIIICIILKHSCARNAQKRSN